MTADQERAATVAKGLTKAQRAMIEVIANGQPREFALGQTGFALDRMGIVFVNELGARHLTDWGHLIREHLRGGE